MWYTIVTIIHVIVCFFLATVVLLQQGKGSDVNAVFGGSSQTLFGSSGAGNLLTKLTSASAIVFMFTSLMLTYGAARQSTKSLFDNAPVSAPAPTTTPEGTPAAQSSSTRETSIPNTASPVATSPSPQTATSTEGQQSASTPSTAAPAPNPAPDPASQPKLEQTTPTAQSSSTTK